MKNVRFLNYFGAIKLHPSKKVINYSFSINSSKEESFFFPRPINKPFKKFAWPIPKNKLHIILLSLTLSLEVNRLVAHTTPKSMSPQEMRA